MSPFGVQISVSEGYKVLYNIMCAKLRELRYLICINFHAKIDTVIPRKGGYARKLKFGIFFFTLYILINQNYTVYCHSLIFPAKLVK